MWAWSPCYRLAAAPKISGDSDVLARKNISSPTPLKAAVISSPIPTPRALNKTQTADRSSRSLVRHVRGTWMYTSTHRPCNHLPQTSNPTDLSTTLLHAVAPPQFSEEEMRQLEDEATFTVQRFIATSVFLYFSPFAIDAISRIF
ncbi:hypothetical protein RB595_010296 [Gaeumannomyces hyphopodioides]